ncbi:MAG: hypothetical protein Q4A01_06170 [Coriobacteriales bacterium]|nr:hypothetical protein [Coriobacteriales bacterium]
MAIIRNERARNREPEVSQEPEVEEEEIDYDWHPTEDEYVSPITAQQWAELLASPSFVETDQAKAVRCLREYGGPATFQQLSIRYRGTMGRYRRWLGEAAQQAGERFGVPAPQQDRFGMDEWWPLLYQTRATGKVGAGVFEMMLRPEVEDAFLMLEEQEREARKAENARNLKRIEQLERARQEERERRAAQEAERAAQEVTEAASEPDSMPETAETDEQLPAASAVQVVTEPAEPAMSQQDIVVPIVAIETTMRAESQPAPAPQALPALQEFLRTVSSQRDAAGARFVATSSTQERASVDLAAPIDYALRYAERLREALALMGETFAGFSAALVARELGDESVERLQEVLNGQRIPAFDYVDRLRDRLFVNPERLEVMDGRELGMPVFASLDELWGPADVARLVVERGLAEVAYVVDDARNRRTGVILRFSRASCTLLTRAEVPAESESGKRSAELDAFVAMVDELDEYARAEGVERTSRTISASQWDALVAGTIWPGSLLD